MICLISDVVSTIRWYALLSNTENNISSEQGGSALLQWDDPYYDIARHQIVEVAGKVTVCVCVCVCAVRVCVCTLSGQCIR